MAKFVIDRVRWCNADNAEVPFLAIHGLATDLMIKAVDLNDSLTLSPREREQGLIELFASHGHELEFTGGEEPV